MRAALPAGTTDDDENLRRLDSFMARAFGTLCARLDMAYASEFGGLIATPAWLDEARAGEGAHPGAGGYRRMADLILASEAWRVWMA